ncbi:hypothetical protein [Nitrososphaera viennensis]|uniref:Uncharacterized protein n=2 Tax=Nitrososphaera viennensis TaxID=1034015 RepID=A0A060HQK6_9ARCH|nr:hypothetical protein [Nitrososphaera viennensis]AIC15437.1 hypothetical protein NVIE_012030 [Nitrososphaera viennensis EN76]UVS70328.1 hypothetical protein NWT39_05960 [Nitrososphaera viennensis]
MVAIGIEGIKERYRINEPIEFSVIIKGILSGNGFPRVKITNEKDAKNKIYDMAFMSPLPTERPKYTEQVLHFPRDKDRRAPIRADEAGIYKLTVTVNTEAQMPYEVNRKIVVDS